jgi:hypothetical protein
VKVLEAANRCDPKKGTGLLDEEASAQRSSTTRVLARILERVLAHFFWSGFQFFSGVLGLVTNGVWAGKGLEALESQGAWMSEDTKGTRLLSWRVSDMHGQWDDERYKGLQLLSRKV